MRLGFIGGSGHFYLRGAIKDAQAQVEAVAVGGDGRDNVAARKLCDSLPGAQWFEDGRKMLDRFKPDVLNVGAVYAHNGDWVAEAMERGLPTVSDKPIAASQAQFERLRSLCRCASQPLLTEFDFHSRPAFRACRQAVQRGLVGEIVLVTAQKSYRFGSRPAWYASREDYPGTLMWIASHGIDAVRWVSGKRFALAVGRGGNLSRPGLGRFEDHVVSLFGLEGGATAVVHADFLRPPKAASHGDDRLRVAGTQGLLEVRDGKCLLTTAQQEETDITASVEVQPIHRELLAALRGEGADLYNTADSLAVAEILLHARAAADTGKTVEIGSL